MKGPKTPVIHHNSGSSEETSVVGILFLGAIDLYRTFASPARSSRCGFHPSCSTFGRQAVSEYGPLTGLMMTGDRLTRCNIFKKPGQDYFPLPGGRLYDPVSSNVMTGQSKIP